MNKHLIHDIAKSLLSGQLCIFPCDTIWGIMGLAQKETAIKLAALKKRPSSKGFVILIPKQHHLSDWVDTITDKQYQLMRAFWPGELTMIFKAAPHVPTEIKGDHSGIAIRHPQCPLLNTLLDLVDAPLISSSVNLHGAATIHDMAQIPEHIKEQVAMIYPNPNPLKQTESSIIDCQTEPMTLLREGKISKEMLSEWI